MDTRLVVLKRFLDALGVPSDIDSLVDRKRVQKAVYLGQALGEVNLGYRFGWYVHGPYSPPLAKDYYNLAAALEVGEEPTDRQLRPSLSGRLANIKPRLEVPGGVTLEQAQWMELLASWHYLRKVSDYDEGKARATILKQKPQLAPYLDQAKLALSL